jgi:hypothetical protein
MDSESTRWIDDIRSKVRDERALISALQEKYPAAKDIFKSALNFLNDVEAFFLNAAILQEPRGAATLASWLSNAENVLQMAIKEREQASAVLKKVGPTARLIP